MYQMDQYTMSLLHFEDGFKDDTGKVWTTSGGATTTAEEKKDGNASSYFEGVEQDFVSTPMTNDLQLGNNIFTIDFWIKPKDTSDSYYYAIVGNRNNWRQDGGWLVFLYGNNSIMFSIGTAGTDDHVVTPANVVAPGKWSHIAIVKDKVDSPNIKIYVDGIKKMDANLSKSFISDTTVPLRIGRGYEAYNASYPYKGYVDEFRISKGIARWTDNFDPANPPSNDAGKLLLTITLDEEVEREYVITKEQVDAFVVWYTDRSRGTGPSFYTFDKSLNRKDYLVFDKIITFEVTDFTK